MKLHSPQKVVSDRGFTIQVADRYTVEYIENSSRWVIDVDFEVGSTGVYRSTLKLERGVSATDEDVVFNRVIKALALMGLDCEVLT